MIQETGVQFQKTQKMVLDAALLNTVNYKVWIKDNEAIKGEEYSIMGTLET